MNTVLSCKNQNTLTLSPTPLSKIRNWSPAFVTWSLSGNTRISSLRRGIGGKLLSFRCKWIIRLRLFICGRLTAAVCEIFWRAVPKICWGMSCVACDLHFIDAFIFVTSIWFCDGGLVCSLISPDKFTIHMKVLLYTAPYVTVHIPRTEDCLTVLLENIGNHFEWTFSHLFQLL